VFPFASLHPNAGAQLCVELQLLPDILLNHSNDLGDVSSHASCGDFSVPTITSQSLSRDMFDIGSNIGGNSERNSAELASNTPYCMCPHR